jgi:hypothetical protein
MVKKASFNTADGVHGDQDFNENYIDIKEFREKGYLQEVNRRFLHPLGLSMEIGQHETNGDEIILGIIDLREEGIKYDLQGSTRDRIERFKHRKTFVDGEMKRMEDLRGFAIKNIYNHKKK